MMSQALSLPLALPGFRSRVTMVMQSEAAECGLACLCMVANYHGDGVTLNTLRQNHAISLRGATMRGLMDVAASRQFSTRALRLEVSQLDALSLPAILHWDMKHFVVLTAVKPKEIEIHDPAIGVRRIERTSIGKHFTGVALELNPTSEFQPVKPEPALRLSQFWQQISGLKSSLGVLFILSLLLQIFAIASPYYMQTVIDDVLLRQQRDLLTVLAMGFALLLIIEIVTTVTRRLTILSLSTRLQVQMSANVFYHLIRLPHAYFMKRHTGDVVSRFSSLAKVREFLTVGLVSAVLDGLMAIVTLVVLLIYSPLLCAVVIGVMACYITVRVCMVSTVKRINSERIAASAREQSHFMETVRAMQTIKQGQQEALRQAQWQNHLTTTLNSDIKLGRWDIRISSLNQLLFGVENIIVIYVAALLVMDNAMTVGMLYAFISYKNRFIGAIDSLVNQLIEYSMLGVHLERLSDIVFTEKEPVPALEFNSTRDDSTSALTISQVQFRHDPQGPYLFRDINYTFTPGSVTAIVGPSGVGKTTLLKCLMGLITPDEGSIHYGGQPIAACAAYRSRTGSVMQDDQCLSGSVADNISGFSEHLDIERMVHVAQQACLHDDIMAMPMQYQTLIGDMGASLSGGQLQRLMIARALYRQPDILFMDEASSNLDLVNESRINENLAALNITRIIVAHRPQTIAMADRVLRLTANGLKEIPAHAIAAQASEHNQHEKGD